MWAESQRWEREWHGNCTNSLGEEVKQLAYAARMGLLFRHDGKTPYTLPLHSLKVVDVGGGPHSLLLRVTGADRLVVVDPLGFPSWVYARYKAAKIEVLSVKGEDMRLSGFDEAWIYNVLQHVDNPQAVIEKARAAAKTLRVFEWINTPTNLGHPQTLTKNGLDKWLRGEGKAERIDDSSRGLHGECYHGTFKGGSE